MTVSYTSLVSPPGILNVLLTNPLWVVNSRLKMCGVKKDVSKYRGILDGLIKIAVQVRTVTSEGSDCSSLHLISGGCRSSVEWDQGLPPVGDQPGYQVHILRVVEETLHDPLRPVAIRGLGLRTGLSGHCYSHGSHLSSPDGSGQTTRLPLRCYLLICYTLFPGTSKTRQPLRGNRRDRVGDCLSERSAGTVPRPPVQAAPVHDSGRLHVHELREHLPPRQHSDGITGD